MPFALPVARSTSKFGSEQQSGIEGSPLLVPARHVLLCYAKWFWHTPTSFVLLETNLPELPPTCDPSAGGSRPVPATLRGPPTLT